ncbi:MAG: substrate-binding domain-containing protein, partial [Candidatus Dormibacteraeota bacterium]|nr:substrate-binding domain-containing protein [Candidatus Dormibacteraeota bacterium]
VLLSRIQSGRRDLTAVFVANDQMSLGLIRALREGGVRIPEDVSVVGFDDQPEAGHFLPPLTTVKQDFGAIGRRCVAALIDTLNDRKTELLEPIQPELIVRLSTGPPPAR